MLMLNRKRGEQVELLHRQTGDRLAVVTVVEMTASSVLLGFAVADHLKVAQDNWLKTESTKERFVFERRRGEEVDIIFQDGVETLAIVTVMSVAGASGICRLGFSAPDYVRILRDDVVSRAVPTAI